MEQVQKSRPAAKQEEAPVADSVPAPQADLSETDDLLDEIDAVLEQNAEEFVSQYIQKGGE